MDGTTSSLGPTESKPASTTYDSIQKEALHRSYIVAVAVIVVVVLFIIGLGLYTKFRRSTPEESRREEIIIAGTELSTLRPNPRCPGIALSVLSASGLNAEETARLDSGVRQSEWAAKKQAQRQQNIQQPAEVPKMAPTEGEITVSKLEAMETGRGERRRSQRIEQRSGRPQGSSCA